MREHDRLQEMLKDSKEDAPMSVGMFREFRDNHFTHLKKDVKFNRKLLWLILAIIIASALADKF